jgi:hypothetical protein
MPRTQSQQLKHNKRITDFLKDKRINTSAIEIKAGIPKNYLNVVLSDKSHVKQLGTLNAERAHKALLELAMDILALNKKQTKKKEGAPSNDAPKPIVGETSSELCCFCQTPLVDGDCPKC